MAVQPSRYTIKVRDNNLNLIGEIDEFQKLQVALRFNGWGTWELTLDKNHPMAGNLATPGYGIYVVRNGTVLFSGPMNMPHRKFDSSGDLLIASGFTDEVWLAKRDAWPVYNFPYVTQVLSESGLQRFYELQETAGTSAVDSKNAVNGTYTNGVTLNQTAGFFDDPGVCAAFASASTQYVTTATMTGMPTGNGAFTIEGVFNDTTFPAAINEHAAFGKSAANSCANLFTDASGFYHAGWDGGNATAAAAVTAGTWHHVAYTYDGTTVRLYIDGAQSATATPGTLTLPAAAAEVTIGAFPVTHANPYNGKAMYVAFYSVALSASQVSNHYNILNSRFAYQAYDIYPTSGTTDAESVLQHYVNVNAGPGAISARQVTGLTLGTNNHNGGSTSAYTARFDDLIASDLSGLLQQVANAAGVGFQVLQVNTGLVFSVYVPTDRSTYAIFSQDLGNLVSFDYASEGPDPETGGNYVVIGGAGDGTARTFYLISDSGSITDWGRAETFFDQRNTSTIAQLAQAAADQLTKDAGTTSFTATLLATDALEFQTSTSVGSNIFNLGDKVTAIIDGVSYSDYVREIDITVDSQGGEVINPIIGTPTTKMLRFALDNYSRVLKRTTRIVKQLQRAQ